MAMLFRWRWRFFHNLDLIWVRLLKAIYGSDGGCGSLFPKKGWMGPWNGVISMMSHMRDRGLDLLSLCPIRIGDGSQTSFW